MKNTNETAPNEARIRQTDLTFENPLRENAIVNTGQAAPLASGSAVCTGVAA